MQKLKFPKLRTRAAKRPVTILKSARDIIARGEWIKGDMVKARQADGSVCFCAVGAVAYAAGFEPETWEGADGVCRVSGDDAEYFVENQHTGAREAIALLRETIPPRAERDDGQLIATTPGLSEVDRVISYNDAHGRRRADVVAWFDRAIARAEAGSEG